MESMNSQLYDFDEIDAEDELEVELSRHYAQYREAIRDKTQIELHNYLQDKASQSKLDYSAIVSALLYGILTEPENARTHFQSISFVNRDRFATVLSKLHPLAISVRFHQLKSRTKEQMLWFLGELTSLNIQNVESIYLCLFRQMRSGDLSSANTTFCEQILKLCEAHRSWLDMYPRVIATAAYSYLRLIADHRLSQFASLQQREIKFVTSLLREKWLACCSIGRDLVRILQDVLSIPEFSQIWNDILHDPHELSPRFKGLEALLKTPTPREFLRCRLAPDMETKLLFIMQNLRSNQYQRTLGWFLQRYLSTCETFYVDVIRYIVAGWYPSNQILQSDIVPRYVVIGSMLRAIKSPAVVANVKLALVFDWLYFTPTDNIMFIEPSMLLMERSAERYPYITAMIMEYLKHAADKYYPPMRDYIRGCITCGMRTMLEKGVIRSLSPIYNCPTIDGSTREIMLELFSDFLSKEPPRTGVQLPPVPSSVPLPSPLTQGMPASGVLGQNNSTEMSLGVSATSEKTEEVVENMTRENEEGEVTASDAEMYQDDDVDRYLYGEEESSSALQPKTADEENSNESVSAADNKDNIQGIDDNAGTLWETGEIADGMEGLSTSPEDMPEATVQQDTVKDTVPDVEMSIKKEDARDIEDTTGGIESSQSYWIFGDSLTSFKSACISIKANFSEDNQAEVETHMEIAKRNLNEILSVFLRMAISSDTLASSIAPQVHDVADLTLLKQSHINKSAKSLSIDQVITEREMDLYDVIMANFWINVDDAVLRDKIVNLLGAIMRMRKKAAYTLIGMRWWADVACLISELERKGSYFHGMDISWFSDIVNYYKVLTKEGNLTAEGHSSELSDDDMLKKSLVRDTQLLAERNLSLFHTLIPLLYRYIPTATVGNQDFLKIVVSTTLPYQLGVMVRLLKCGYISVYGDNIDQAFFASSLEFDSYETMCLWEFFAAELHGHQKKIENLMKMLENTRVYQSQSFSQIIPQISSLLESAEPTPYLIEASLRTLSPPDTNRQKVSLLTVMLNHWSRTCAEAFVRGLDEVVSSTLETVENDFDEADVLRQLAENFGRRMVAIITSWASAPEKRPGTDNFLQNKSLLAKIARLANAVGENIPKEWTQDIRRRRRPAIMVDDDDSE